MLLQTAPLTTSNLAGTTGWLGGRGMLYIALTGTAITAVTLTWAPLVAGAQGTFVTIQSGVSLAANGLVAFEAGHGFVKATLTGGDGTSSVVWGVGMTTVTQH